MPFCIGCTTIKKKSEMALEDTCFKCYKELNSLYHRKPEKLVDTTPKKCLKCGEEFDSDGIYNRICKICRLQNRTVKLMEETNPSFSQR